MLLSGRFSRKGPYDIVLDPRWRCLRTPVGERRELCGGGGNSNRQNERKPERQQREARIFIKFKNEKSSNSNVNENIPEMSHNNWKILLR